MPECFRTLQVEIQFISTVTVRQLPAGALPAQMRAAHVWLSAASATAEHLKTWEPAAVLSCNRTRTAPARGFHTEPDRETVAWAAYLWPCWQVADRPLSSLACSVCTYLQRSSPEHRWDTRILINRGRSKHVGSTQNNHNRENRKNSVSLQTKVSTAVFKWQTLILNRNNEQVSVRIPIRSKNQAPNWDQPRPPSWLVEIWVSYYK